MGKIIVMGDFIDKKQKEDLMFKIQERVNELEEELGLEEPLTVLTDDAAISVINNLIDVTENLSQISDSVQSILEVFNFDGECEELPE